MINIDSKQSLCYKILVTIIIIVVAHHLSMLLHEWTHGTFAWLFGYKKNPFDIYYGDWTLLDAWELIDYKAILSEGKGMMVSIIAISPIILSAILYLIGIKALASKQIQSKKTLWYFLFWFTLSNLGQVLDYIPIRTFTNYKDGLLNGDIGHFIQGLNLSPWLVFSPGILFVLFGIWKFFKFTVPQLYVVMEISETQRSRYLLLVLVYLFSWYGAAGFQSSLISKSFSCVSILLIPILFKMCNPSRDWVKNKITRYQSR